MKLNETNSKRKIHRFTIFIVIAAIAVSSIGCAKQGDNTEIAESSLYDFTSKISQDNMMATINTLAGKDNARTSGFEGEQQAADYIKKQFESFGLETNMTDFPVEAYLCNTVKLSVNTDVDTPIESVKVINFSSSTPKEGIRAEIVSVSMGSNAEYSGKNVKGKIALIQRGGEKFVDKAERAKSNGAVAAIFYDPMEEGSFSATFGSNSTIPGVGLQKADALIIEAKLAEGKTVEANLLVDSVTKASKSQNIFGLYKSSNNPDKKQIIISAHYDGVDTPAANDNASGLATILEIARVLTSEKPELPYDIQFMAFGSEEIGLIGSSDYAHSLDSLTTQRTLAMINFDMVGVGETVNFCTANAQSSEKIMPQTLALGKRLGFTAVVQEMESSDHVPLAYAGIPAITYYVTEDENYHTDLDTPDRIQPEMLAEACNYGLTICTEFKEVQ